MFDARLQAVHKKNYSSVPSAWFRLTQAHHGAKNLFMKQIADYIERCKLVKEFKFIEIVGKFNVHLLKNLLPIIGQIRN